MAASVFCDRESAKFAKVQNSVTHTDATGPSSRRQWVRIFCISKACLGFRRHFVSGSVGWRQPVRDDSLLTNDRCIEYALHRSHVVLWQWLVHRNEEHLRSGMCTTTSASLSHRYGHSTGLILQSLPLQWHILVKKNIHQIFEHPRKSKNVQQ